MLLDCQSDLLAVDRNEKIITRSYIGRSCVRVLVVFAIKEVRTEMKRATYAAMLDSMTSS